MANTNYTIKETISFAEFTAIVDFIVERCFDENDNYNPTHKEFWTRYCLINYYSDFPLYTTSEHTLNEIFEQVYGSECVEVLTDITSKCGMQYYDMQKAIDSIINHKLECQYKASPYSMTDVSVSAFFEKLIDTLDKLDGVIDDKQVMSTLNALTSKINDIAKTDNVIDSIKSNITVTSNSEDGE